VIEDAILSSKHSSGRGVFSDQASDNPGSPEVPVGPHVTCIETIKPSLHFPERRPSIIVLGGEVSKRCDSWGVGGPSGVRMEGFPELTEKAVYVGVVVSTE